MGKAMGSNITSEMLEFSRELPMMRYFGYAQLDIPPVYGEPEPEVKQRAQKLHQNSDFRKLFKSLH